MNEKAQKLYFYSIFTVLALLLTGDTMKKLSLIVFTFLDSLNKLQVSNQLHCNQRRNACFSLLEASGIIKLI